MPADFIQKDTQLQARRINGINYIGLQTLIAKEVGRFINVYTQTIVAPVVTTLLYYAVFALAFGADTRVVEGLPYLTFLAPGLIMMTMVQNAFANTSSSIVIAKVQGNIVDVLMPPVSGTELFIGYTIGGIIRGVVVGAVCAAAVWASVGIEIHAFWAVIVYAVLGNMMLSSLGLAAGIWSEKFDHIAAVTNFIVTPLTFLSGTFYSVVQLPAFWQGLVHYNPFFYMIDGFRYGFTGHADGNLMAGLITLIVINIVLAWMSLRMIHTGYKIKSLEQKMSENFVQSFQLESTHIRGRIVRLDQVLDDILLPHDYPDDVRHLTGEVMTLCVLLSSMLKYDGIFTLQIKGDGAVTMLVADMTSEGHIRACATYREDDIGAASYDQDRAELLGKGYMAFTVDQGEHADRYQGIVELKSTSLISSVQHYFSQSEQIRTGMMMSVGKIDGKWRATGIMVQAMPDETHKYNQDKGAVDEEDWRRTMILLGSIKEEEMLSDELTAQDLLVRLFHEEGVRVFDAVPLLNICRCNAERVENVLATMSADDIEEITVDGKIVMTCEFCSKNYEFDPNNLKGKTS